VPSPFATASDAQRRMLEAAIDLFAERGLGGTSTRDIAARAQRSPAALYVHYPSKEHLLYALSIFGHEGALEALRSARDAHEDPALQVWEMIFAFSRWHMENARLGRVVQYELHALSVEHRTEVVELRRRTHGVMIEALERGSAQGRFHIDDLHATGRALLSLGIDLARWFDPSLPRDIAHLAGVNADLALRIVGFHRSSPHPPGVRPNEGAITA